MRLVLALLITLTVVSCSSEKITISPVYDNIAGSNTQAIVNYPQKFNENTKHLFYASELSSQASTFPTFKNKALNQEVGVLKYNIKEYVFAVQEYNLIGQDSALVKLQKSYRKIQKLRKNLSIEEDEVINRYLVRIKSNLEQIENFKKDSLQKGD